MLHGGWFQKFPRIILLGNFLDTHTQNYIMKWLIQFLSLLPISLYLPYVVLSSLYFINPELLMLFLIGKKNFFGDKSNRCKQIIIMQRTRNWHFFLFSLNCQLYIWFTFGGYWMMWAYFQFIIDLQIHFLHIDDNRWWPMCFFF